MPFCKFYANISFNAEKTLFEVTCTEYSLLLITSTQRQFSENIYSEDDLRSRIFGTFVLKFLACLPVLGFSNI